MAFVYPFDKRGVICNALWSAGAWMPAESL